MPNAYFVGSYRIAITPEPNSSRLMGLAADATTLQTGTDSGRQCRHEHPRAQPLMMMGLISRYLTGTPMKTKLSKAATVRATIRKTVRTPSACEGLCL
jgi:hypothetical protein